MPLILNQPARPAQPNSKLTPGPGAARAAAKARQHEKKAHKAYVKLQTLTMFTQQLAAMLEAGLPLVTTLEALQEQIEDPVFRTIVREVRNDIATGTPFSEAVRKWPRAFPNSFCSLVEAGEASGTLAEMLDKVATYFEATLKLQKKVKSAMTYPVAVLSIAVVLVNVLLIFVVPVFADMFSAGGKALPAPTQFLIDVTNVMKGNLLGFTKTKEELLAAAVPGTDKATIGDDQVDSLAFIPWNTVYIAVILWITFLVVRRYFRTQRGKQMRDRLVTKVPVLGELTRKVAVSRFCRTFSILTKGGVPILKVIDICARASDNVYIEDACVDINKHLNQGGQLSEVIATKPYFHSLVRHMIRAGEQTGNIDGMLTKVSNFYDQEIENMVGALTSLMEPLLICFLGVVIGGIVVCMFLPIFNMSTAVGG